MTNFEQSLEKAQNEEKIVYYDYLSYKRAAGWWSGLINDDWNRPIVIKKAKYNAEFLHKLPQYYFLGFPIKELLKVNYANGYCHACAVALSLYFKTFEIITCNLQNYADHYTIKSGEKTDYEHSFLLIDLDGKKTVIDTTFGFITDFETYKEIFNPNDIRIITSEQLEKVKPYQYIKSLKEHSGPPIGFKESVYDEEKNEWHLTEERQEYERIMQEYMDMCRNYNNAQNHHLTDFINRCLFETSHIKCNQNWRDYLERKEIGNTRFEYPQINLFSLEDDEFDENLYSTNTDTIARNKRVLFSYHNQENNEDNNPSYKKPNIKIRVRSFINKIKSQFICI